uniref:hypothetical protein n=1 Tax=Bacteroides eggerthii TaxID=28111 RepID=UPI003FEED208
MRFRPLLRELGGERGGDVFAGTGPQRAFARRRGFPLKTGFFRYADRRGCPFPPVVRRRIRGGRSSG